MPSKKATKVAYVVLIGRQPGVYATWSETEKQVKGYPNNKQKGYTQREGGWARAERELEEFLKERGPAEGGPAEGTAHINTKGNTAGAFTTPNSPISLSLAPVQAELLHHEPLRSETYLSTTPSLQPILDVSPGKRETRPMSWDANYNLPTKMPRFGDIEPDPDETVELRSAERHVHNDSVRTSPRSGTQEDNSDETSSTDSSFEEVVTDKTVSDGGSTSESHLSLATKNSSEHCSHTAKAMSRFRNADQEDEPDTAYNPDAKSRPQENPAHDDDNRPEGPKHDEETPEFIPLPPCSSDYGDLPDDHPVLTQSSALAPVTEEVKLGKEQAKLVELIMSGRNVFYTGSAGVGKSTVLRCFVSRMRQQGKQVDIVAPTGKAALEVDGYTFWMYAGWTPELLRSPMTKLESNARYLDTVQERLRKTDVLVVDEISMFENHHFERLNRIMKSARNDIGFFGSDKASLNNQAAFGGVQLIVTGDFCQLPPVKPFEYCMDCERELDREARTEYRCPCCYVVFKDTEKWAFCSAAWTECKFTPFNLTEVRRQSDQTFIDILQRCRYGQPLNAEERNLLLNHQSETTNAVQLFPRKDDVKRVNDTEFDRLQDPIRAYTCIDDCWWNEEHKDLEPCWIRHKKNHNTLQGFQHHPFEPRLRLRTGMLVILLVNLDFERGLVNGSQGVILGFKTHDPANLKDPPGNYSHIRKEQIKKFIYEAADKEWPLVHFRNGTRNVTRLIKAECRVHEKGHKFPYSYMHRTQIPLMAAWAMTIHKAQGMTLSRVEVNLTRSFEKGQDYVALSRATSLAGLKVHGLNQRGIGGNKQVMKFMKEKFANDPALMGSPDLLPSSNKSGFQAELKAERPGEYNKERNE